MRQPLGCVREPLREPLGESLGEAVRERSSRGGVRWPKLGWLGRGGGVGGSRIVAGGRGAPLAALEQIAQLLVRAMIPPAQLPDPAIAEAEHVRGGGAEGDRGVARNEEWSWRSGGRVAVVVPRVTPGAATALRVGAGGGEDVHGLRMQIGGDEPERRVRFERRRLEAGQPSLGCSPRSAHPHRPAVRGGGGGGVRLVAFEALERRAQPC